MNSKTAITSVKTNSQSQSDSQLQSSRVLQCLRIQSDV